ncbi:MAG: hypothetical protein GY777_19020, partial [Candidatus Brocadiaceae bacterium]|nr:hypothetical protein [Candidatus Brocadiaceae bacterium]
DVTGNESDNSNVATVTIDTKAPGIPTDLVAKDDDGLSVDTDPGTADTTPTITVSLPEDAEVGDVLKLYNEDNEVIGEHKLTQEDINNGTASVTPEDELEDQTTHEFTTSLTDEAGNESGKSDPIEVKVDSSITPNPDTEAPDAPVISAVENDDDASVVGKDTNDTKLEVTVDLPDNAVAGDTVTLYSANKVIGTHTLTAADIANKKVEITTDALDDKEHKISATVKDVTGNESDNSNVATVTIDTKAPGIPTDLVAKDDNGLSVDEDPGTADTTPTVTVSLPEDAEVGDVLKLYNEDDEVIGEHKLTQEDINNGTASVTPEVGNELPATEPATIYPLTVSLTDEAGNESGKSDPIKVKVDSSVTPNPDTEAPDAPVIRAVENDDEELVSGKETNDNTLTVTVDLPDNAEIGDKVTLYSANKVIGTYTLTAADITNKKVEITTDALTDKEHKISATVTDTTGNESENSNVKTVTIDTILETESIILDPSDDAGIIGDSKTTETKPKLVIGELDDDVISITITGLKDESGADIIVTLTREVGASWDTKGTGFSIDGNSFSYTPLVNL